VRYAQETALPESDSPMWMINVVILAKSPGIKVLRFADDKEY
jgi:hypothetical protein